MKKNTGSNTDNYFISYDFEDDIINCLSKEVKYKITPHPDIKGLAILTLIGNFQMGDNEICYSYHNEEHIKHDFSLAERIYKMKFVEAVNLTA